MTRRSHFQPLSLSTAIAAGLALGLTSAIAPPGILQSALAQAPTQPATATQKSYTPPPPSGYQPPSAGGGVRGNCSGESSLPLLALAPQFHRGQTSLIRPTLAWFVPEDNPGSLILQVFQGPLQTLEQDSEEPLYDVPLTSRPGIMTWTVPEDGPALNVGEIYAWRIILICDENRPSLTMRDMAELAVVSPHHVGDRPSTNLVSDANQMAASGLWYDALALTLDHTRLPQMRSLRISLLETLAELEANADNNQGVARAQQLRDVLLTAE